MFGAAQRADQLCEVNERSLVIAGHAIRLRFAGAALVEALTKAFAHVASSILPDADLDIFVSDCETTGVPFPAPPWEAEWRVRRTEKQQRPMLHFEDGRFVGVYEPRSCLLSLLDTEKSRAVWWVPKRDQIPPYEHSAPFRSILHWWMREQGLQTVHAGAVGNHTVGVLLVGRAGSGKSTTALAAVESGLRYLGDDYVLVQDQPVPKAWGLYRTGKLTRADVRAFPHLAESVSELMAADGEKTILFLNRDLLPRPGDELVIGAILVPTQTKGSRTRLAAISASRCLSAMAPSTMLQLRGAGRRDFENLARLVRQVPCFRLELGSDKREVQKAVLDLLATL